MKLLLFATLVLVVYSPAYDVHAQKLDGGQLVFRQTSHRFDKPIPKGKTLSHRFEFENKGSQPVVIWQVQSTCYCIVSYYPKRAIQPGEKAFIEVKLQTAALKIGPFERHLLVISNATTTEQLLRLEGVIASPDTLSLSE